MANMIDAERLMMQKRIDNLMEQLELVKRQRDAAIADLSDARNCCKFCKHDAFYMSVCDECKHGSNFEWRGLPEDETDRQ